MEFIHSAIGLSFLEYVGMFFVFVFFGMAITSFWDYVKANIRVLKNEYTFEEQREILSKPTNTLLKILVFSVVFQLVIFGYYLFIH